MPKPPRSAKFKQGGRPHARRLIAGKPGGGRRGPRAQEPRRGWPGEAASAEDARPLHRHQPGQPRRTEPARRSDHTRRPSRRTDQAWERSAPGDAQGAARQRQGGSVPEVMERQTAPDVAARQAAPQAPLPPPVAGEALYGLNPVLAALQTRQRVLRRLYVRQGRLSDKLAELVALAQQGGLALHECTPEQLQELCGSSAHQGAVLACGPLPRRDEHQALPFAAASGALPLLVVLDEIEDPQNLGAIVRSCAQFGVAGVVVPRHHGAPLSPAASKASAGELERLPVFEAANLSRFLEEAKGRGFWVAGAVAQGGTPLPAFRQETPLLLVVGNEGRGLRPLVERHCDLRLTIPLAGQGSLNVSAATAVLLYQLRQAVPAPPAPPGQPVLVPAVLEPAPPGAPSSAEEEVP